LTNPLVLQTERQKDKLVKGEQVTWFYRSGCGSLTYFWSPGHIVAAVH